MITEAKLRKAILAGSVEFKLDGVANPVKAEQGIIDGKIEFVGKNFEGKTKTSRMDVSDFCKIANFVELNEVEREVAEMEEPIDTATPAKQAETGSGLLEASGLGERVEQNEIVDLNPSSDIPAGITDDMLQVGYRFVLSDSVGEVEIVKLNKKKVSYLSAAELALDARDRPDPIMVERKEFLARLNAYLDAKDPAKTAITIPVESPKVRSKKEIEAELTVKKSTDKLQVDLTPAEILSYYEKLSGLIEEVTAKESEKSAYVSQIGGEIKELKAEINTLTGKVNSKKEFREVPTSIEYHWKKNKKLTIRLDTGAIISETAIPKNELQNTFIEE